MSLEALSKAWTQGQGVVLDGEGYKSTDAKDKKTNTETAVKALLTKLSEADPKQLPKTDWNAVMAGSMIIGQQAKTACGNNSDKNVMVRIALAIKSFFLRVFNIRPELCKQAEKVQTFFKAALANTFMGEMTIGSNPPSLSDDEKKKVEGEKAAAQGLLSTLNGNTKGLKDTCDASKTAKEAAQKAFDERTDDTQKDALEKGLTDATTKVTGDEKAYSDHLEEIKKQEDIVADADKKLGITPTTTSLLKYVEDLKDINQESLNGVAQTFTDKMDVVRQSSWALAAKISSSVQPYFEQIGKAAKEKNLDLNATSLQFRVVAFGSEALKEISDEDQKKEMETFLAQMNIFAGKSSMKEC